MLSIDDVRAARRRIALQVHRTPVLRCTSLDACTGAQLFFKAENFQKTGAFKARGATNAVFALEDATAHRGVVTHSSGNHGAAVARAAQRRGISAHIVMPHNAAQVKQDAVRAFGATVVHCASTLAAREETAARVLANNGGTLIHPYNDWNVMAGQGTAALELLEDVPDLDVVVCPVGGGGLLSGTAVAAKALRPRIRVVGAEPAGADDAARSFRSGQLAPPPQARTIADGLRGALGDLTFQVVQKHVDAIETVEEEAIIAAMRLVWERLKIVIEPSSAVAVAAVLGDRHLAHKRVGVILSGGNVDLDALPWLPQAADPMSLVQ